MYIHVELMNGERHLAVVIRRAAFSFIFFFDLFTQSLLRLRFPSLKWHPSGESDGSGGRLSNAVQEKKKRRIVSLLSWTPIRRIAWCSGSGHAIFEAVSRSFFFYYHCSYF